MNTLKKIYSILKLLLNFIIRRKHYHLSFFAEVDPPFKRWYYDFKHWGFQKANLEMVAGADKLCDLYAKGNNKLTIDIIVSNKPIKKYQRDTDYYDTFVGATYPYGATIKDKYIWGRDYTKHNDANVKMWICPVTLFVLGRYPKYIYVIKNQII